MAEGDAGEPAGDEKRGFGLGEGKRVHRTRQSVSRPAGSLGARDESQTHFAPAPAWLEDLGCWPDALPAPVDAPSIGLLLVLSDMAAATADSRHRLKGRAAVGGRRSDR